MSNALKGAFDAKIGKVPVVAIGVPLVIAAVVASRFFGKKDTSSSDGADSQPAFFAKDVPDTWAAIDPSTGVGHSPDGTVTYIPTTGGDPTTPGSATGTPPADTSPHPVTPTVPATPKPTPKPSPKPKPKPKPPAPKPKPPGSLSPHQKHLAHEAHVAHVAHEATKRNTPNHALPAPKPKPKPPAKKK